MIALHDVFWYVVVISIVIVVHEYGHYAVARWCGVRVLRFSIGFGKPLVKWVRGKDRTEWVISALPMGGYVAMQGEQSIESERAAGRVDPTLDPAFDPAQSMESKSVWARAAISAAGPFANMVLAIVLYWAIGLYGVDEPRAVLGGPTAGSPAAAAGIRGGDEVLTFNDEPVRSLTDFRWLLLKESVNRSRVRLQLRHADGSTNLAQLDLGSLPGGDIDPEFLAKLGLTRAPVVPKLAAVVPGGVAERAGLKAGDKIVSIDGQPADNTELVQKKINRSAGQKLILVLDRAGTTIETSVVPEATPQSATDRHLVGRIGIGFDGTPEMVVVRYGPIEGIAVAIQKTWDGCKFSLKILGNMLVGKMSLKNLSGPGTTADYARQSASFGLISFVQFVAGISVAIGLMNLLPVPILDGGQLLYYFAEIVRGRPLPERFLDIGRYAGAAIVIALMSVAIFNDVVRFLS